MKIVVGMSGGVDSSVAALLLKEQGHDVTGIFMNNWEEKDDTGACTSERDWADVRAVCDDLGIPYYSVNFARQYQARVFAYFLAEYRAGRTPNPDVLCNREIKFAEFLDFALKLGAQKLATGHFAGIEERADGYHLMCAKDAQKDQTYFLCLLGQRALSHALFPLREYTKAEVREIARKRGLPVSEKKDSTGVCFIGERSFKPFLMHYLPAQPGPIVDVSGKKLGRHDGLMYYTLGQRRGLGIGGGGDGRRWFVVEKDLQNNRLVVEQGEDSPRLYSLGARVSHAHWVLHPVESPFACQVRLRHRQPLQDVVLLPGKEEGEWLLRFAAPQRAVTPGQFAAFYRQGECLGGATIEEAFAQALTEE